MSSAEATDLPVLVIPATIKCQLRRVLIDSPSDPVLSAALYVESNQIEPSLASVEQVVLDVVHKAAVKPDEDIIRRRLMSIMRSILMSITRRRRITFDCCPW